MLVMIAFTLLAIVDQSIESKLNEIGILLKQNKIDDAKSFVVGLDLDKLAELNCKEQKPIFIGIAGYGVNSPGLDVFHYEPKRLLTFPGISDVIDEQYDSEEFFAFKDIAISFAKEFNLRTYHCLSEKGDVPVANQSFTDIRKDLKIEKDIWESLSLVAKLNLQYVCLKLELIRHQNTRLLVKVDDLQSKLRKQKRENKGR